MRCESGVRSGERQEKGVSPTADPIGSVAKPLRVEGNCKKRGGRMAADTLDLGHAERDMHV